MVGIRPPALGPVMLAATLTVRSVPKPGSGRVFRVGTANLLLTPQALMAPEQNAAIVLKMPPRRRSGAATSRPASTMSAFDSSSAMMSNLHDVAAEIGW